MEFSDEFPTLKNKSFEIPSLAQHLQPFKKCSEHLSQEHAEFVAHSAYTVFYQRGLTNKTQQMTFDKRISYF
jgi:hypothetical protein